MQAMQSDLVRRSAQMKAHRLLSTAMLALASSMAGCASSGHPEDRTAANTAALPGKPACFFLANVRGTAGGSWTVVNDSTLIMKVPAVQAGTPYLIKLLFPVFDLPMHLNLGFEDADRNGKICDASHDRLIVPHYQPPTDPIVAVRELTADEVASLQASSGKSVARKGG
jgi:hypothetical protein